MTDIALVGRAQLGDRAALDRLLQSIEKPLFHHIVTITADSDTAADVLQETLLTICRKLKSLREPRWFRVPASQVVVRMHYLDDMTIAEISEALELSPGTVKTRLSYGLSVLRSGLERSNV